MSNISGAPSSSAAKASTTESDKFPQPDEARPLVTGEDASEGHIVAPGPSPLDPSCVNTAPTATMMLDPDTAQLDNPGPSAGYSDAPAQTAPASNSNVDHHSSQTGPSGVPTGRVVTTDVNMDGVDPDPPSINGGDPGHRAGDNALHDATFAIVCAGGEAVAVAAAAPCPQVLLDSGFYLLKIVAILPGDGSVFTLIHPKENGQALHEVAVGSTVKVTADRCTPLLGTASANVVASMLNYPPVLTASKVAALLYGRTPSHSLGEPSRLAIASDGVSVTKNAVEKAFKNCGISLNSAFYHHPDGGEPVVFATPSKHTTETWRVLRSLSVPSEVQGDPYRLSFTAPRTGTLRSLSVTSRAKPCRLHLRLVMMRIGVSDIVFLGKNHTFSAAHSLELPTNDVYSFRVALMSDSQIELALDSVAEVESHGYSLSSITKVSSKEGPPVAQNGKRERDVSDSIMVQPFSAECKVSKVKEVINESFRGMTTVTSVRRMTRQHDKGGQLLPMIVITLSNPDCVDQVAQFIHGKTAMGSTLLANRMVNLEQGQAPPTWCYKCGAQGHYRRHCTGSRMESLGELFAQYEPDFMAVPPQQQPHSNARHHAEPPQAPAGAWDGRTWPLPQGDGYPSSDTVD